MRQMAVRLGLSRDTVSRDLDAIGRMVAESAPPTAEPATHGEERPGPVADPAPQASEGVAQQPRRVADPLAGMDVSQWRALRHDLAVLAQSGLSAEALVHRAVVALAHQYRQDLAAGRLKPGQRFLVRSMDLYSAPAEADRRTAAAPPSAAP
ncbi:hypothetical protein [Streptomyces sp. NPDC087856]|uniref:hypothetical protein n=1 Tax=Streptomyces sp. NPDC087856 TaxID=3365811 RepID=UPI003808B6FD